MVSRPGAGAGSRRENGNEAIPERAYGVVRCGWLTTMAVDLQRERDGDMTSDANRAVA